MGVNWTIAYNRLFKLINTGGETYYSGSDFLRLAQEVDDSIPSYKQFIDTRNQRRLSTSRQDFYWDVINKLEEPQRLQLYKLFIEKLEPFAKNETENIKQAVFGGGMAVPTTVIPQNLWNSEKLNKALKDIDNAIFSQQFNRAVTLAYTCLEGLYKAYLKENLGERNQPSSLLPLAKLVKDDISEKLKKAGNFPEQIVNAVANSRNGFSESHFNDDANKWLAIFTRDLTNSIGRLLLQFIKS